jgi:hypothetical protein
MSYLLPQATVQQDFNLVPTAVVESLKAIIVGANYKVFRYTNATEKGLVSYGKYNYLADETHTYLNKPTLSTVDQESVELYFDNLLAQYASISGTNAIEVGSYQNQIKIGAGLATGGFKAYGAYPRLAAFKQRDVQIGDRVKVTHSLGSMTSRVTGFVNDVVASSMSASTNDSSNAATVVAVITPSIVVANGDHVISDNASVYTGSLAGGWTTDTYTLTCTTGGSGTASRWSITSTHGDNSSDVAGVALAAAFNIGSYGVSVEITGTGVYVAGESYSILARTDFTRYVPTVAGTYTGAKDTIYMVKVIRGGAWASSPQVVVTTNNGYDTSGPVVVASNTSFALGNYGATIKFPTPDAPQGGLLLGDTYYVTATAATAGAVRTLKIADQMPSTWANGDDLTVDFRLLVASKLIPAADYPQNGDENLTVTADNFTVKAGIDIYDSTWVDNDAVTLLPIPVVDADVYVPYKALLTDKVGVIGSISSLSSVSTILGEVIPENPISYGVYKALENSGENEVYYLTVETDDLAGYVAALGLLETSDDFYLLAPMTQNQDVIEAYKAHVLSMSEPNNAFERILVASQKLQEIQTVYGVDTQGDAYVGYIAVDPLASPAVYTKLTLNDATMLTDGVRPGDLVRTSFSVDSLGNETYSTYTVEDVTSETTLDLVSPGAATSIGSVGVPVRIEIVRALTKDEQADKIAANSSLLNNRRVTAVWPDIIEDGSTLVSGCFLAAAVAGLKSSVVPHQGITNVTLNGFSSASRSFPYFTPTQMNRMAEKGTFIVTQQRSGGTIYVRHQITTDPTDVNMQELSITTNLDSISKFLRTFIKPFIGQYNINPNFLKMLETLISERFNYLKSETITQKAGAQLVDWDPAKLKIEQDPLIRTRVTIYAEIQLPYPANNIDFKLVVV